MKITEEKHNHKLTNLLKVFIFSILMLLPFINVGVRCAYVTFNKNAYQSYSYEKNLQEVTNISNTDNLIQGKTYYFDLLDDNYLATNTTSGILKFTNTNLLDKIAQHTEVDYSNVNGFSIGNLYGYFNINTLTLWNENTIVKYWRIGEDSISWMNKTLLNDIWFTFDEKLTSYNTITSAWHMYQYILSNQTTLDNVFEYSLNKLEDEQYLTWTQNTAVYQGVESMTTGLGITQTVIPMLIVYWFMLTIIYVIIDIVLAIFTKLTHMIGNKTT